MKAAPECFSCLERLISKTAELATSNPEIRARAIDEGMKSLKRDFSYDKIPTSVASRVQRLIREITRNPDPYREIKDKEIEMAGKLYKDIRSYYGGDLSSCLMLSVLGNTIDFFREPSQARREMTGKVRFVLDDTHKLASKLEKARKILYLADNAGECFFDLPLVRKFEEYGEVTYVVKESPVQDDITAEDLKRAGMEKEIKRVITTGTATAGIDFSLASRQFKEEFDSAGLVFAKGMGYYETLSEEPIYGKVFYCFMAKCPPVANSLGLPLNSYVAMFQ